MLCSALAACGPTAADLSVLTQHNSNRRTGAYLYETQLTPTTVGEAASTFGLLYRLNVGEGTSVSPDARIAAQPLFVKGVIIGGKPRDVLYVVTMAESGVSSRYSVRFEDWDEDEAKQAA